jgi:2-polyprenyl-3-methyl-5-hydroxy-6-metoxy-1,4-benzoquinol methylase
MVLDNREEDWNNSYKNRDNYLFTPNEECIRFISKHIRKRIGLDSFKDIYPEMEKVKILDLGCGIGRHIIYGHDLGLDMYGIDLSMQAIKVAKTWADQIGVPSYKTRIVQGDIRKLPWNERFFSHALSHGVLDSMPFDMARESVVELSRTMIMGGLFYCDLISSENSQHTIGFTGEEIVNTLHERSTVQSYFDMKKIKSLFKECFSIKESYLVRNQNTETGEFSSRHHLVLIREHNK